MKKIEKVSKNKKDTKDKNKIIGIIIASVILIVFILIIIIFTRSIRDNGPGEKIDDHEARNYSINQSVVPKGQDIDYHQIWEFTNLEEVLQDGVKYAKIGVSVINQNDHDVDVAYHSYSLFDKNNNQLSTCYTSTVMYEYKDALTSKIPAQEEASGYLYCMNYVGIPKYVRMSVVISAHLSEKMKIVKDYKHYDLELISQK